MKTICFLGPDGAGKTTIIRYFKKILETERNVSVASVSTTQTVPGYAVSDAWRQTLVSADSTNFERFNAAYCLYNANISHFVRRECPDLVNDLDYLVLDRGGSSMVTYNPLPDRDAQFEKIPHVDYAFYVDAQMDILTTRLMERSTHDFQDTNHEFRERVHTAGPEDFRNWIQKANIAGYFLFTNNGTAEENAQKAIQLLFQE